MSKLKPLKNHNSPDVLESHLSGQERTLAVLLEQAFRIKEQVAAGFKSTEGSLQVHVLSRKLLENHILTITRIVKQLSKDIQTLERHITERDSFSPGTTTAVQNLDHRNIADIGDLRVRVTRCDASIARLTMDVSSREQQLIRLQQEVTAFRSNVDEQLQKLEAKVHQELGKLETSLIEISKNQRSSVTDMQTQVKLIEKRMLDGFEQAKQQTDLLRKWTEQQFNSSVQHCTLQQDKMSNVAERLCALEAALDQFKTQKDKSQRSQMDKQKRSETKLSKRLTSVEIGLHRELQLLKQEYQKGFVSVHDAIESLRQIGDIKSCLDQRKVQKDIRHNWVKSLDDQ